MYVRIDFTYTKKIERAYTSAALGRTVKPKGTRKPSPTSFSLTQPYQWWISGDQREPKVRKSYDVCEEWLCFGRSVNCVISGASVQVEDLAENSSFACFKFQLGRWRGLCEENGGMLRVFENKVLRKIFGAKRDEVKGEWRKLHNTELHALNSSPDIIRNIKSRRLRWAGHVARMGESRNAYRVLVGSPEGKRPLGRPRRRWKDNIKMDLREVGYDDRDWINPAQDRDKWRVYVRAAMNLRVP
ncbi:hypothetical protein ANN_24396 [Periplaneta americana]|uniref:Uncharacterized protein n=1 Tax=Periplaneta americana TaxID=6978 RepID=A0ABQ8S3B4_PERAM|nr:hypothetical protein ANN_24396 [Periplaneta americana]